MYLKHKKITEKYNSESLKGKRCFILAGGENLNKLDFSLLTNEFTIGINRTFERFPTSMLYCMDNQLYGFVIQNKLDSGDCQNKFNNFPGDKIFLATGDNKTIYNHGILVVNRICTESFNFDNLDAGIYTGSNSAFGAIMLAIALGCRDIYLIGYAMQALEKTHFHSGYPKQEIEAYRRKLEMYKKELFVWTPRFNRENIRITNLVIESENETALRCFPIKKLEEVIT